MRDQYKIVMAVVCLTAPAAIGQSWEPPASRFEQLRRAVQEKQANLSPETEPKIERMVESVTGLLARPDGLGLKFGGLMSGSGFGFGPQYRRNGLFNGRMHFHASAVGSVRGYYAIETGFEMPRIFGSRFDLEVGARHSDAPSIAYFGSGAESRRSGRSSYRREDTELRVRLGWRPNRQWLVGYEAAGLMLNIGPGRETRFLSSDQMYTSIESPGIHVHPRYLLGGPFVQYDTRDHAGLPHHGGRYSVQMLEHWDRSFGRFSFRRVSASAERYISFLNNKRTIALRARTDLSFTPNGQTVPFYMQPTLGGPDDVRGYSRFRFQAANATVFNAEYRWEVSQALDMAMFADAGNVFERPGLIGFRDMKTAAGLGFRVKTRDAVVLRMDAGASREGVRLWISFSNIF